MNYQRCCCCYQKRRIHPLRDRVVQFFHGQIQSRVKTVAYRRVKTKENFKSSSQKAVVVAYEINQLKEFDRENFGTLEKVVAFGR